MVVVVEKLVVIVGIVVVVVVVVVVLVVPSLLTTDPGVPSWLPAPGTEHDQKEKLCCATEYSWIETDILLRPYNNRQITYSYWCQS